VLALDRRLPQLLLGVRLDLPQAVNRFVDFPLYLVAEVLYVLLV
jgi:hypothetical protein